MSDKLTSPFHGDVKPSPSPHAGSPGEFDKNCYPDIVSKPADYEVLSVKFYEKGPALDGSPEKLSTPFGTSIPNAGHGFRGDK
jgi:hypothetical protein